MEGAEPLNRAAGTSRRAALAGLAAAGLAPSIVRAAPPVEISGRLVQGGQAIIRTSPGAALFVDGERVGTASPGGWAFVGLDRDAASTVAIALADGSGRTERSIDVARGDFDIQRINGLPPSTVTPQGEALLARIRAEAARKQAGFASRVEGDWFKDGFAPPLKAYRITGRFGGQRILNGEPRTPHYGADMAAPRGTPVLAPAGGVVSFAETGLHFEGGLIMIDHGQGVITAYLHLSRVDVAKGQVVARGSTIGAVGAEGRATGPHLCWRMKWRGRNMDPTLMVRA